jgi:hypothetical protein
MNILQKTPFPRKKCSHNNLAQKTGNEALKPQVAGLHLTSPFPNPKESGGSIIRPIKPKDPLPSQQDLAFFPNPQSVIGPENFSEIESETEEAQSPDGSYDSMSKPNTVGRFQGEWEADRKEMLGKMNHVIRLPEGQETNCLCDRKKLVQLADNLNFNELNYRQCTFWRMTRKGGPCVLFAC